MLRKNSSPSDIEFHIEQMEILLMDKNEKNTIEKIMQLESIVEDSTIQHIIQSELNDENWNYETKVLINYCKRKLLKSELIQEHIKLCNNFLVYKYLEEKLFQVSYITAQREQLARSDRWIFSFQPRNEELDPCRWANTKFVKAVNNSNIDTLLLASMDSNDKVIINSKWLSDHYNSLFNETIFEDINNHVKEKMQDLFQNPPNIKIIEKSTINNGYDEDTYILFQ